MMFSFYVILINIKIENGISTAKELLSFIHLLGLYCRIMVDASKCLFIIYYVLHIIFGGLGLAYNFDSLFYDF